MKKLNFKIQKNSLFILLESREDCGITSFYDSDYHMLYRRVSGKYDQDLSFILEEKVLKYKKKSTCCEINKLV
jgi:hypothetical protein